MSNGNLKASSSQEVHETKKRNIFAQWRMSHCGNMIGSGIFVSPKGRTDVQWLLWVVFGSVGQLVGSSRCLGRSVMLSSGHHHQVGCQLRLYPGGLWSFLAFHPSMDFPSDHRAHQSGCDSHHLLQLHVQPIFSTCIAPYVANRLLAAACICELMHVDVCLYVWELLL